MRNLKTYKVDAPEPYPAQCEVIKSCVYGPERYTICNGGRQLGKTVILITVSLAWALNTPEQLIMVVSPTDKQVKEIYDKTCETIKSGYSQLVKSSKASPGTIEISFVNGSRIIYRSAEAENSLRGYALNYLLVDEASFIKEKIFFQVLTPSLLIRGKKVYLSSTPCGNNYFKKLFQLGQGTEESYKSFKITYRENPYVMGDPVKLKFIQEQERILPKEMFEQEYLGEFSQSASVFKYVDELATLNRSVPQGQEVVAGIDIAMLRDYTVCTILDTQGNLLDYLRFNKLEMNEAVSTLEAFLKQWNPRKIIIETNNQGITFYSMLKERGFYQMEPFVTTNTSKHSLINELMSAFAKKEIRLLNDDIVKDEFKDFTYTLSDRGTVTFAAATGHDDIVLSFGFAFRAKQMLNSSQMFVYRF